MNIFKRLSAALDRKCEKYGWYGSLKNDYGFRTLFFAVTGAFMSLGFAVYNGVFAVIRGSLWHGVFAGYLLLLSCQRAFVTGIYRVIRGKYAEDAAKFFRAKLKIYLATGIIFVPSTLVLSFVAALLVTSQKPIVSNDIMAITTATYTFCKTGLAIRNLLKARALQDPIVQTSRNISIIDALVSMVMLESTLITTFGELTQNMRLLIALSGMALCLLAAGLGVYMIVKGAKKLKRAPA